MNYFILGASSGLGRELAYSLAKKKNNLVLISRDNRDLKAIERDLQIRFKIAVRSFNLDLTSIKKIENFFKKNQNLIKDIDGILMPVGMMKKKDKIINNFKDTNSLIQANLGSIIYFVSKFYQVFIKRNKGTIVGFGSIAEMLGREENVVYSSSKRGLSSFFESLAISSLSTNLKIQFYIVGYLDTNLAYGKKIILPKSSAKKLANIVCENLDNSYKKIYYPCWWILINILFKVIPFFFLKYLYKFIKKN